MTEAEASTLVLDLTKALAAARADAKDARRETEAVRLVARAALYHANQLERRIDHLETKQQARDRPTTKVNGQDKALAR